MDPKLIIGLIEIAKISLNGYFEAMRLAGKSDADIDQLFKAEYQDFQQRHPDDLVDV